MHIDVGCRLRGLKVTSPTSDPGVCDRLSVPPSEASPRGLSRLARGEKSESEGFPSLLNAWKPRRGPSGEFCHCRGGGVECGREGGVNVGKGGGEL